MVVFEFMTSLTYPVSDQDMNNLATQLVQRWNAHLDETATAFVNSDAEAVIAQGSRNTMDDFDSLPSSVVEEGRSESDGGDAIIIVEDYTYQNFDGVAQVGPKSGPGVAVLGAEGQNELVGFHEILHTFSAEHDRHRVEGYWITKEMTVMGDSDVSTCFDDNHGALPKGLNPSACTIGDVNGFVDDYV